ncbi:hypothetical protein FIBSPDRAFT_894667 [Athelia psychrophila]|uniref:MYND-type domain-containing protein n=1 Tax=Athelia psychrophila TaxID=1759441 RepID=A0A166FKP2_9AGAM|nr:hypothetical protein FIBSPDRAFT_894667 [Fibularhizoctonia sp. CBS 109695]
MPSNVNHRSAQSHRSLLEIANALPLNELPNAQTHIKQWIAESDRICTGTFDPSKPLPFDSCRGLPEDFFAAQLLDENVLQEIAGSRRFACITRNQLSWSATILFFEDSFEEKWLALSAREREKHLLSAFKQQEGHGADFSLNGQQKLICPELCWDKLVAGNGRGFLNLLMTLMLDNNDDPPTQPLVLEQPRFDAIIGWSEQCGLAQKAWLECRRVSRTQHIVRRQEMVHQSFTHEHSKTKETLSAAKPLVNLFMGGNKAKADQWVEDEATRRKQMKLFCENCFKSEDKKEGKMSACGPCKKMGREDCQKKAWKLHKRDCGKILGVDSLLQDVAPIHNPRQPSAREDIPAAAPGYRRTPYLLQQISFMNEHPQSDYIFYPDAEDIIIVTLDELAGAAVFNIMRNRCLASADESALFYLYRALQRSETMSGNAEQQPLRKQLLREYGTPFENVMKALDSGHPPAVPTVSPEDIDRMLVLLQKTSRFAVELRDYTPGAKGKKTVRRDFRVCSLHFILSSSGSQGGFEVGPKKDLSMIVDWPADTAVSTVTVAPLGMESVLWHNPPAHLVTGPGPNHRKCFPVSPRPFRLLMDFFTASSIPAPLEGFRRPALERQLHTLCEHPGADYVLWGQTDAPAVPHGVYFDDMYECMAFLAHRHQLLQKGAEGAPDDLAYVLMALETVLLRKKIPMNAVRAQLASEYGESAVRCVVGSIAGGVYTRAMDGKAFEMNAIPVQKGDVLEMMKQLKRAGRFPHLLDKLTEMS